MFVGFVAIFQFATGNHLPTVKQIVAHLFKQKPPSLPHPDAIDHNVHTAKGTLQPFGFHCILPQLLRFI
jgi:hypothetical protein